MSSPAVREGHHTLAFYIPSDAPFRALTNVAMYSLVTYGSALLLVKRHHDVGQPWVRRCAEHPGSSGRAAVRGDKGCVCPL